MISVLFQFCQINKSTVLRLPLEFSSYVNSYRVFTFYVRSNQLQSDSVPRFNRCFFIILTSKFVIFCLKKEMKTPRSHFINIHNELMTRANAPLDCLNPSSYVEKFEGDNEALNNRCIVFIRVDITSVET